MAVLLVLALGACEHAAKSRYFSGGVVQDSATAIAIAVAVYSGLNNRERKPEAIDNVMINNLTAEPDTHSRYGPVWVIHDDPNACPTCVGGTFIMIIRKSDGAVMEYLPMA